MSKLCIECGAKCCKYFCLQIDTPDTFEEFENIRWYLSHEDVTVHVDEGDWYMSLANRCRFLGEDNRCLNYENRPLICRKYHHDNCDHSGGDYGYDEYFTTPRQIEDYARKTIGAAKYERQRAKAFTKAEKK